VKYCARWMIKKREETTRERVDKENNIQIKFD
jgi:hypothetical protein